MTNTDYISWDEHCNPETIAEPATRRNTPADFYPGQLVRFIPNHAAGDRTHPDCENGRVTSTNEHFVFVRFGQSEGGQACNPDQLK